MTGALALTWLRVGAADKALALAERQFSELLRTGLSLMTLWTYVGLATLYREQWIAAQREGSPESAEWKARADRLCKELERGARTCALAIPASLLCRGQLLLAEGKHRSAQRSFEAAMRAANRKGMPWEAAEAHSLLAPLNPRDRTWHLAEVRRLRPPFAFPVPVTRPRV